MEVLDVWKNLNSQVNAITKKQIAVFPDTLKPKTQRDLEVEVNVDKSVEGLNNMLESRLASLEFVLKNDIQLKDLAERGVGPSIKRLPPVEKAIPEDIDTTELNKAERKEAVAQNKEYRRLREEQAKRMRERAVSEAERGATQKVLEAQKESLKLQPFQNAYESVINTGSIVSQWNAIVRFYQKQGLARQSQEMVKVKVQDLIPNLEAILYGLGEAVNVLFSDNKYNNQVGLKILELLRSQSVYQLIKGQIDSTTFEIISVPAMDTAFKNIFASLSEERRELLDEISSRGAISNRPIRQIPAFRSDNFQERLKALASEMGVDVSGLPESLVKRLSQMNRADFEKYADKTLTELKSKGLDAYKTRALDELQKAQESVDDMRHRMNYEIPAEIDMKRDNIRMLDDEDRKEIEEDEDYLEEMPEPEAPQMSDDLYNNTEIDLATGDEIVVFDEPAFERDYAEYVLLGRAYDDINAENDRRREANRVRGAERGDVASQAELRASFEREIEELEEEGQNLEYEIEQAEEDLEGDMEDAVKIFPSAYLREIDQSLKKLDSAYSGRLQKTKGKGMPIARGLAGMGSHYGAGVSSSEEESDSDSDSDEEANPFDFDDRRNDSYYSRPRR